ncbi:MAG: phosphoglycerate kinase [Pseudomonadota bacterium]
MSAYRTLDDLDVRNQRVLVRVDFNVPMADGVVTDATRIERAAETIRELTGKGAKVVLLSHFGRPKGEVVPEMSLAPVAKAAAKTLDARVAFAADCVGESAARAVSELSAGHVLLLENTRFHAGEEKNDAAFVTALAENGDLYVNDAFSAAHRAHASTEGLARALPAAAGRAMERELSYLSQALSAPKRPLIAIVGGAKISSKLDLLSNLVNRVNVLVIGGGMANTFLAAQGTDVGASLCEHDLGDTAREILAGAHRSHCEVLLPSDVVVAKEFKAGADRRVRPAGEVAADEMILDVGPDTVDAIAARIEEAETLVWNGPLGAFEIPPFDTATIEAARFAGKRAAGGDLVAVAGGGDTVSALNHAGAADDFTYVSTAGGAFLEWLEGKTLPGVKALEKA